MKLNSGPLDGTLVRLAVAIGACFFLLPVAHGDQRAESVSLVRLLANPEMFDGKRVVTYGFAVYEFENHALYLSEDAAKTGVYANAIWLVAPAVELSPPSRSEANRKAVGVEGVFNAHAKGHMALFSGSLEQISRRFILSAPASAGGR